MCAPMRATASPLPRIGVFEKISAAAPFGVGHDRLPADFMKRNVLRRMPRCAGNRQRGKHALRIACGPLQDLHAAHRSAGDREQRLDAEMVEQHRLRAHHVANCDDGKIQAPRLAGFGIDRRRAGRAHAGADHVRADHEIALGVDRPAGADHGLPPARLLGNGMHACDVLVARERMTNQHGVGARGIQPAIGLVGDLKRGELDAGVEPQWPVPELGDERVARLIRFARCINRLTRACQFGFTHDHPCAPGAGRTGGLI